MKILVLGAGATGGYFAGRLAQQGADVTFLVRERRAAQLAANGLVVRSPHGDFTVRPKFVQQAGVRPEYDLVMLTCKAYDLDSGIEAVRAGVGAAAHVIPLLNGIAHIDRLAAEFGAARVIGGTCGIPATLTAEGEVRQLGPLHRIAYGMLPGTSEDARAKLEALHALYQRTPIDALLAEDITLELWEKFVLLATMAAMTSLMRGNYQHSSWLSMMDSRLSISRRWLRPDGGFAATIDDNEQPRLRYLLDSIFGSESLVAQVAWEKRYTRSNNTDDFTSVIDYLPLYSASDDFKTKLFARDSDADARYSNPDNDPRGPWKSIPFSNPRSARERPTLCYPITSPHTGKTKMPSGEEKAWRSEPRVWDAILRDKRDWWGKDGTAESPSVKRFLSDVRQGMTPINFWEHEFAGHTDSAKSEIKALFGYAAFDNPKPTQLVKRVVEVMAGSVDAPIVLDYFAGSGTTGHAVINLNREDGGQRKLILVEMGDHFDTVLLPRIKKVTFSPEWKDGKPKRLATAEEAERSPRIIKVIRLESYEDALNNLETHRTDQQQSLLDAAEAQGADGLREQYILRYMLDVETRGSASLLNVRAFTDPTAYKLKVKRPGSDESREVNVDLLETFNWLIGLTVRHIAAPQTFSAEFERDGEKRLRLKGRLRQEVREAGGAHWFRTVAGTTPDGRRALVIWRKLTGEAERDSLVLDEWFTRQGYSAKDSEFDLIYVNGGNNLENLKTPDDRWKVRLIEEDFHRLMFETEGA